MTPKIFYSAPLFGFNDIKYRASVSDDDNTEISDDVK
jgi:hypothetical protein